MNYFTKNFCRYGKGRAESKSTQLDSHPDEGGVGCGGGCAAHGFTCRI